MKYAIRLPIILLLFVRFWAETVLNEHRFWLFLLGMTWNEVISFHVSEKRETTKVVSPISALGVQYITTLS